MMLVYFIDHETWWLLNSLKISDDTISEKDTIIFKNYLNYKGTINKNNNNTKYSKLKMK